MPRKPSKTTVGNKLDKAWSLAIRSKGACEVCGSVKFLNPHHVVGRRNYRLRWELFNGVCLCSGCHTMRSNSAHQNPIWFEGWLKDNRAEDYDLIKSTMYEIKKWSVEEMIDKLAYLITCTENTR